MSADTIELRLAELRAAVDVGNERTAGQLALLVERSNEAKLALEAQRTWVEKELERHTRDHEAEEAARTKADEAEQTAREKGDEALAADVRTLLLKNAVWTGVGFTLSALGGTLLGHLWPH